MCVQGQELLLSGYLPAMPKTAPRATVSCAEMLLEHECKQTPTCCRWGRAQPHCTARNHLGWCSGWLCYGVLPFPKPVCSLLAFLQAAGLRGSRAEHPTQLLDRGDRQGAGKVAADVGGGFPILPLQGRKERQLAVEEPSTVSICDHQHLPREGAVRAREHSQHQPAGPSCPTDMLRAGSVPPHTLPRWGEDRELKGPTPALCQGPTVVTSL